MKFKSPIGRYASLSHWLMGGSVLAFGAFMAAPIANAELKPSLNLYGATGLIDMPSGDAQPDAQLSVSANRFGPISRNTLSFQVTPRLSASFRFLGIRDWNKTATCQPNCAATTGADQFDTYYDRSFDLRFKAVDEGRYLPAVTIGLQDFAGTGVLSGEYIAATKTVTPDLKVTAGLGWGRLGSSNSIGSPFGVRPPIVVGSGGKFNIKQWFKGPAAPFGGIEWQVNDQWSIKGEYSSDAYAEEAGLRSTFDRKSSFNFGVEYQPSDYYRLGAYYMYGTTVGIAGQFFINPKIRPSGGIIERAPQPVVPRPSRSANPKVWSSDWAQSVETAPALRASTAERLKDDGILVESLKASAGSVQVRIRNTRYLNAAEAIGRTARALSQTMPASVETFEIVPLANGVPASKVTVNRSDLETLEFSPDGTRQMAQRVGITGESGSSAGFVKDDKLYPAFSWSIGPNARFRFFDQKAPFKADLGIKASARYEISPGLAIEAVVTQKIVGNLKDRPPLPDRALQPVRSAVYFYDKDGTTAIEKLAVHWHSKLGRDVYTRVSAGYLERMFGGVSTEMLWKPTGSRWALGAEVNYLKQRAPDQHFGFTLPSYMYAVDSNPAKSGPSSYATLNGHVSAYYEIGQGFHAQLDVGKYLAGDIGATLSIDREFANGWRIGAFATKTDVSAADFGSGSFDKGIKLVIPLNWSLGSPSRKTTSTILRPFRRDGGARLEMDERLYDSVRGYHESGINDQFGRFWK
jgi:hypothetical protein